MDLGHVVDQYITPQAFGWGAKKLAYLSVGSHSGRLFGSSNPDGSSTRASETQHFATLGAKEGFPYKFIFREAQEIGSKEGASKGMPSWIDLRVMTTHSSFTHLNKLVGMADAIYHRGPWLVKVLPYRSNEFVCEWAAESEESFFYFYETLFSKLGITLPFTEFEQAIFYSLNIAPTPASPQQLGLCVGMEKVGWTSLSSRPWQKLMMLFCERYKQFKEHFFPVAAGCTGPNDWENEFIEELGRISPLSCSKLISNKGGYSVKDIVAMRARSSCSTTLGVAKASLLSTARLVEEGTQPVSVVVLESVGESPTPVVEEIGGSSAKHAAEAGVLQSQVQLSKRALATKGAVVDDANFSFSTLMGAGRVEVDETWVGIMAS
ncbi:hypothetical protein CR513_35137, partial [Mucuna pruriens]